jgi:hypothetical protein
VHGRGVLSPATPAPCSRALEVDVKAACSSRLRRCGEWVAAAARGDVAVESQRVIAVEWACERENVSDRIYFTENLEALIES